MFLIPSSWYQIKRIKGKGRGVFALHDIEPGAVIGDYLGKIVKPYSNDEKKDGLYDMQCGLHYDVVADPKTIGIHLINHSCSNNCELYPHLGGHVLFVALRKIFKGEELTVNYGLGVQDEKSIPCALHACHCGSKICRGTMHEAGNHYERWYIDWESLVRKNFGIWYRKVPGKYGAQLAPLETYPVSIDVEKVRLYEPNLFGSEMKPRLIRKDRALPKVVDIKKLIRATGRQLSFPNLHLAIYGVRNGMVIVERI
jgi:hypothetical protein